MPLFEFIAGLAILIVLHEFGHFVAARLFGVEVEEFGIGFPPRLVKLFEIGGTEYTLNWIPLGGFVRPKGENDPEVEGGLAAASPWVRLVVLAAGPLTNILIGVILGVLLFYSLGDPIPDQVKILGITPDSPAETAGLQEGDLVLSVSGEKIDSIENMQEIIKANLGQEITLEVRRGNQVLNTTLVPRVDPPEEGAYAGVILGHPTRPIGLIPAIERGADAAYQNIAGILMLPVRLASGTAQPEEGRLIGYKGLYDIYTQIRNPLWFFMLISISLGVLNLFPIPALDGGRMLLTLPEILLRRRIPPRYENMIHLIGFTLLLILIIFINVQDFINPVQLP